MFLANFGKSRMVFPQGHPYYKRLPKEQEHLLLEKSRAEVRRILDNAEQYKALKANPDYKDVDFEWKNGGVKATHKDHNFDKDKGWYEKTVREVAFNAGNAVILESEAGKGLGKKYTEGTWNGLTFEIGAAESATSNNIKAALNHCAGKPDCNVAVVFFTTENVDMSVIKRTISCWEGLIRNQAKGVVDFDEMHFITPTKIIFSYKN